MQQNKNVHHQTVLCVISNSYSSFMYVALTHPNTVVKLVHSSSVTTCRGLAAL